MEANKATLVIVDGVRGADQLTAHFFGRICRAGGRQEVSRLVTELRPDAVLIDGDSPWQRTMCAQLPPERRPAILAVCQAPVDPSVADEWVMPEASAVEGHQRIRLALSRARLRRQSARRSSIDFLTGLPNRRSLVRALVREAARARRTGEGLSLVLLDLDGFKRINETHGHAAGDRLLRQVGQVLRRTTRENEWVGRIGGDEFALVIPGDETLARRAAARVRSALGQINVSATLSVCERHPGEHLRELYRRADRGLLALKVKRRTHPDYPRPRTESDPGEHAPRPIPN